MRVISQDGMIDIPYGTCVVFVTPCRVDNTAFIKFVVNDQFIEIGHYSSLEKAKDVLEDMRICYANGKDFFMIPVERMVKNET